MAHTTPPFAGDTSHPQRFLRRNDVEALTGLRTSSLYAEMAKGTFPKPINITAGRVAWLENEVAEWQQSRIAAREAA